MCAHRDDSGRTVNPDYMPESDTQKSSATAGYADGKKRTNLSIQGDFVKIAQQYFPSTSYGSLSGFVEKALASEFRKKSRKLRAMGLKLPAELFAK